jgi:hypothetical protein
MFITRRAEMRMSGEGDARFQPVTVRLYMPSQTREQIMLTPLLFFVCQADVVDDNTFLQPAEQIKRLIEQPPTIRFGIDRDLALVVAVNTDDLPSRKRKRALIRLFRPIDQITEKRHRRHFDLTTLIERACERGVGTVNVGEERHFVSQPHRSPFVDGMMRQSTTRAP